MIFSQKWINAEFVATKKGRLLVSAIMLLLLLARFYDNPFKAFLFFIPALLIAYSPFKKMALLLGAGICVDFALPSAFKTVVSQIPFILPLAAALLFWAKQKGRKGIFAHPVLGFSCLSFLLAGISNLPFIPPMLGHVSLALSLMLASIFGYLLYAIQNITSKKPGTVWENLAFFHVFWGPNSTPMGKGLTYTRKFEARNDLDLAESQISALKILAWILFFLLCHKGLQYFSTHLCLIPTREQDLQHFSHLSENAPPMDRLLSWGSVVVNFLEMLLTMTITGNSFVAIAHFAGFRISKNTIAPLYSSSIADFWNRIQFYFKEFLVDFFFIPAFKKLTGLSEKYRIFVATMIAAGFGNYLVHMLADFNFLTKHDLSAFMIASLPYACYCVILSIGIGISQLLTPLGAQPKKFRPHICLGVLSFYAFLEIFDITPGTNFQNFDGALLPSLSFHYCFYLLGGSSTIFTS